MNFEVAFTPDKQYYDEAYVEMLSITKVKKWEPVLGTIMVAAGVIFYFFDRYRVLGIFPFVISGIGIYEFCKFYYEKHKWLQDRLAGSVHGQLLHIAFSEDHIRHSGPFSNGEMKWTGLNCITKTKKGILLKPETGFSIYLPYRIFADNGQIDFVVLKVK